MPIYEVNHCEECLPDPNERSIFELENARDVRNDPHLFNVLPLLTRGESGLPLIGEILRLRELVNEVIAFVEHRVNESRANVTADQSAEVAPILEP
jgi:hypothetical protein